MKNIKIVVSLIVLSSFTWVDIQNCYSQNVVSVQKQADEIDAIDSIAGSVRIFTLDDCMAYAVANNQGVKKQQFTNDSYKQDMTASIASMFPSISGNVGATLSYGRSIDPATNTYTTTGNFGNTYSAYASMPVFAGFTCLNTLRMSKAMQLLGLNKLQQIKDELALNTMKAYFDFLYYDSAAFYAKEQVVTSNITLAQTRKMVELGLKSEADLAQIESQVASDELLLIQQQNNADLALLSLKQQMNYPLEEMLRVDALSNYEDLQRKSTDTLTLQSVVDFTLSNNPKMIASEYNVKHSKYNYYYYLGKYLPSINIGGGYSTNYYKNVDNEVEAAPFYSQFRDNRGYYFQATLSIPIFNGLSRRTNAHIYKNAYKIAEQEHSETERALQTEVAQTFMEMKGYDKEYEQASKNVDAASLSHAASLKKFEQGIINPIELQTSANLLMQAKSKKLNAKLQYIVRSRMVDYYNGFPLVREQ